jgi:glycosyltransferase involved in cell wall biosynthesis
LKGFDKVATMTSIEKEAIMARGIDDEKLHVIGAGLRPEEILGGKGSRFRERYQIPGKIVLQISTQTHDKGSPHVIEAMKLLWQGGIDATLVLIGQVMSDFDAYFLRQPPWVYEHVIVLDHVDEETKKDALEACTLFVMPSKAESFGIVYLEAWLYRKPVVGAFAGALQEMIQDGKDGFLVPFADIHMLSEYIRLLLTYPSLADAMGENGYRRVVNQYSWQGSCSRMQLLCTEILAHRKDENRNRYQPKH